jgi:hypothetical protein
VAIGVGASLSSALLVGSAVVFILRRMKANGKFAGGSPNSDDGLNGSTFYGGSPILTKAEMVERERRNYPDSPGGYERRGAMQPGMDRLRIPELQSIHDGNPHSSPTVSELDAKVSPRSKGRRPSTKIYELA